MKQARTNHPLTPILVEAMIASCHATAVYFGETPWNDILKLYEFLEGTSPSAMVSINRIIAESYLHASDGLLSELNSFHDLPDDKQYILLAAKGHLRRQMRQYSEAA